MKWLFREGGLWEVQAFTPRRLNRLWTAIPAALGLLLVGLPLLLFGHLCLRLGLGEKDDALGFFVIARAS